MSNVTMEDVALHAGVSRATVSRVLRNLYEGTSVPITERTRKRVMKAIEELDYCPHFLGTSLASGKSRTVGFLSPENSLRDWFLVEVYQAAMEHLCGRGYNVLMPAVKSGENIAQVARTFIRSQRADGVLIYQAHVDDRWNRLCQQNGDRIVFISSSVPLEKAPHVSADDHRGGYLASCHLIDSGHERIAFVGNLSRPNVKKRHAGYEQAFKERSLPLGEAWTAHVSDERLSRLEIRAIFERLVTGDSPVSACLAASDALAIRILKAALVFGFSVPKQLAIMGFDDLWLAAYVSPALSTVRQDASQIGRRAAEMLLDGLDHPTQTNRTFLVPSELVLRETA